MKKYISTDRAHEITGYSVDYIGQLCRGGKIPCVSVDSEWAVELNGLKEYSLRRGIADSSFNHVETFQVSEDTKDQSVIFDGVRYVTTSRASSMSSYAQDYIGQLVRSGKVRSVQMRGRWYVNLDSLLSYVRSQEEIKLKSLVTQTGFSRPTATSSHFSRENFKSESDIKYNPDIGDTLPNLVKKPVSSPYNTDNFVANSHKKSLDKKIYNDFLLSCRKDDINHDSSNLHNKPEISVGKYGMQSSEVPSSFIESDYLIVQPPVKKYAKPITSMVLGFIIFLTSLSAAFLRGTDYEFLASIPILDSVLSLTTATLSIPEK